MNPITGSLASAVSSAIAPTAGAAGGGAADWQDSILHGYIASSAVNGNAPDTIDATGSHDLTGTNVVLQAAHASAGHPSLSSWNVGASSRWEAVGDIATATALAFAFAFRSTFRGSTSFLFHRTSTSKLGVTIAGGSGSTQLHAGGLKDSLATSAWPQDTADWHTGAIFIQGIGEIAPRLSIDGVEKTVDTVDVTGTDATGINRIGSSVNGPRMYFGDFYFLDPTAGSVFDLLQAAEESLKVKWVDTDV